MARRPHRAFAHGLQYRQGAGWGVVSFDAKSPRRTSRWECTLASMRLVRCERGEQLQPRMCLNLLILLPGLLQRILREVYVTPT